MGVPDALPFLVAEFDGGDSPSARLTRANAGATVDMLADDPVVRQGRRRIPVTFLVKGIGTGVRAQYLANLRRLDCEPQVVREDPFTMKLVGRTLLPIDVPQSSLGMTAIVLFLGPLRNPWIHCEDGIFHLRARIADPSRAEALCAQVRRELEARGLECQVAVQPMDRHDYSVWSDLVWQTLGLAS